MKDKTKNKNPETIIVDNQEVNLDLFIEAFKELKTSHMKESKAKVKYRQAQELKPYQAELIKLRRNIWKITIKR